MIDPRQPSTASTSQARPGSNKSEPMWTTAIRCTTTTRGPPSLLLAICSRPGDDHAARYASTGRLTDAGWLPKAKHHDLRRRLRPSLAPYGSETDSSAAEVAVS